MNLRSGPQAQDQLYLRYLFPVLRYC